MADEFASRLSQLQSLDIARVDAANLHAAVVAVEVRVPQSVSGGKVVSEVRSQELAALCLGLVLRNAVGLEGFFTNVVAGTEPEVDAIPAVLWVLLAGETKRFIEPLAVHFYYAYREEGGEKPVRIPLNAEDREAILLALIKAYGARPEARGQESKEMFFALLADIDRGLPHRPSAHSAAAHPDLSSAVLNAAFLTLLRLRPDSPALTAALQGLEEYAFRRMFADTLLMVRSARAVLRLQARGESGTDV